MNYWKELKNRREDSIRKGICVVYDCNSYTIGYGDSYCVNHAEDRNKLNQIKICKTTNCNSPVYSSGYCAAHHKKPKEATYSRKLCGDPKCRKHVIENSMFCELHS